MPAACASHSPARWLMLPLPAEPKVIVSGFALAAAISSLKLLNGACAFARYSIGASLTMVSDAPMLYLAKAQAPFNNFKELIAAAKAKPDTITFGSAGNGSINHLAGEWLAQAAGIKLVHVPYKGGAPAAQAVAAGDVDFGVMAVPGALPHMKSGRGKVIGISTAKKSPLDASWATPRDAGIPDLDASIWVGLFAPKGTPQPVIERLNKEVRATLNVAEVQKKFVESAGAEAVGMTPAEFLARIKSDAVRYKRVVDKAGIKPG